MASSRYRYFKLQPGFAEKYSAYMIEHLQASGASPEAIEAGRRQMRELKVMLDNPLMNSAMTFTEPFPIGLAVTLILGGGPAEETNVIDAPRRGLLLLQPMKAWYRSPLI